MFEQMKPGHVIRFSVDPATILSPPATPDHSQDNTKETLWSSASSLGAVHLLSHPSGMIGDIAAEVAKSVRGGLSLGRQIGYSALGRSHLSADRPLGSVACDFVGYVDGQSNYIVSTSTVFSKDFSGCLMVAYTVGAERRVAHVAASTAPKMDCKQAFLTKLQGMNAHLLGWFKPYEAAIDDNAKFSAAQKFGKYFDNNPDYLSTFGVITPANQAFSVTAFKPKKLIGKDWIITGFARKAMSQSWTV